MLADIQPAQHVRDILAGLYARKTGRVLPVNDMLFDAPVEYQSEENNKNTLLVGTHRLGSGHFGKKTLVYDRIDLSLTTEEFPVELHGPMLYDELALISEHFGIELTEDDVVNAPVEANSVAVVAKPTSYLYIGSGTIAFLREP